MKYTLIVLVLYILTSVSHLSGQKLYVWCPSEQTIVPRNGFLKNDTIDLVFFDGRVLNEKSRIECTSENVINQLQNFLFDSYPSAVFNSVSSESYFDDPNSKRITIKIGISAYHAAFGTDIKLGIGSVGGDFSFMVFPEGKWNGLTAYFIKIYDYRDNREINKSKEISKISSKFNIWGYKTAIDCLSKTYSDANQEMLFFIDNTLM
ncbi:hypothetical protein [Petrimonas sp.]|jgi:hypothetical protein|uniref:hypothetical protein n=1 Tax=Petrimonas sp. TaxID=2023866 RepID=UPI002FC6F9D0